MKPLDQVKQRGYAVRYLTPEQRTPDVCLATGEMRGLAADKYYTITRNAYGRYNAGCRVNLTLNQALKHWGPPRVDERAKLFYAALLLEKSK